MDLKGKQIDVHDMCLRDGMHPKRHLITVEEMVDIATAMDDAGIPRIEVTHGDGLGGASVNYGFPAASDGDFASVKAVADTIRESVVCSLARAVDADIDAPIGPGRAPLEAAGGAPRRPQLHTQVGR